MGFLTEKGHRARQFALLLSAAMFILSVGLQVTHAWPERRMTFEHKMDFIKAAQCVETGTCELVGPPMNKLRIPLGPLYHYILAAGYFCSEDPRFAYGVVVVFNAVATALLTLFICGWLSAGAGLIAGMTFVMNPHVVLGAVTPSHSPMSLLFITVAMVFLLRWLETRQLKDLMVVSGGLAAAAQLHGVNFILLLPVAATLIWFRPLPSLKQTFGATVPWAVLYTPWIVHAERHGLPGNVSVDWLLDAPPADWSQLWKALTPVLLGWQGHIGGAFSSVAQTAGSQVSISSLGVGTLLVLGCVGCCFPRYFRVPAHSRIVLLLLGVPLMVLLAFHGSWRWRYSVLLAPPVAILASVGGQLLWLKFIDHRGSGIAGSILWWIFAAVLGIGVGRASSTGPPAKWDPSVLNRPALLVEQVAVVEALGEKGVHPARIPRMHGSIWSRWHCASDALARHLLSGEGSIDVPNEELILVENCDELPAEFARWQLKVEVKHRDMVVGAYEPHLGAIFLSSPRAEDPDARVRIYPQLGRTDMEPVARRVWRRIAPHMVPDLEHGRYWSKLYSENEPVSIHLETRWRSTANRLLVLVHDTAAEATLFVGDVPQKPVESREVEPGVQEHRFFPPDDGQKHSLRVELNYALGVNPKRVDFYEEPLPRCASVR